jgi:broad specificity phosphatase PhoE
MMTTRSTFESTIDSGRETKTLLQIVYLIRHGESLGQCASDESVRRTDTKLLDCSLSEKGEQQALAITKLFQEELYNEIEYVVCSPLTRAIQTAILAFPNKPIIIHYELREIGTFIPENIPRPIEQVLHDIHTKYSDYTMSNIDHTTHLPSSWPRNHDLTPKVIRRDKVLNDVFLNYIGKVRPAKSVAVVCHYHVIRAALTNVSLSVATPTPRKSKRVEEVLLNGLQTPPPKLISKSVSTTMLINSTTNKQTVMKTPAKTPLQSRQQQRYLPHTPSTPFLQPDVRPVNAIPIKCLLNTDIGQLTVADSD